MQKLFVFEFCSHLFCIHANTYIYIRTNWVLLNKARNSNNRKSYSNWLNWLHFYQTKLSSSYWNKTIWKNDITNFLKCAKGGWDMHSWFFAKQIAKRITSTRYSLLLLRQSKEGYIILYVASWWVFICGMTKQNISWKPYP